MAEQDLPDPSNNRQQRDHLPPLRQAFSQLRIKLTLPYALLALVVASIAAYLITRLLVGLLENRFETALLEAGQTAADAIVRIEQDQLAAWRAIAYTEGFAQQVMEASEDAPLLASPHAVNARLDSLDVLDSEGNALFALHHRGGAASNYDAAPGSDYADWQVVQQVLNGVTDEIGDKYAALIETEWGWVFYTAGPLKVEEEIVGVLLVGTYLDNVVEQLHAAALANVSIYTDGGPPLVTTFPLEERESLSLDLTLYQSALERQADHVIRQDVELTGRGYAGVLTAFEARHGEDLGVLSVALPLRFVTDQSHPARQQLLILFGAALVLIILAGVLVSSAVVGRIQRLASATNQVAQGDLNTQTDIRGYDEVATLARDFNDMVAELREGRLYRDLLGLTTSPEVAQRLRKGVQEGILQLEAQSATATVLFIDIRGFTRLSEGRDPAYVLDFLNEYLQGLVRIIRQHDGVINKFIGDAAMAFFGVLPEAGPPEQSAHCALTAALAIKEYLIEFNKQRQEKGEEVIRVGIGINTGPVVAGTLGSEERLEYTVLGDTVNVSQRLSDLSKEYPEHELFISGETCRLLDKGSLAKTTPLGEIRVKGRAKPVDVYAVAEIEVED